MERTQSEIDIDEYYTMGFNVSKGLSLKERIGFYNEIRDLSPEELAIYRETFLEPMIEKKGFEGLPKRFQQEYVLIRLATFEKFADRVASTATSDKQSIENKTDLVFGLPWRNKEYVAGVFFDYLREKGIDGSERSVN